MQHAGVWGAGSTGHSSRQTHPGTARTCTCHLLWYTPCIALGCLTPPSSLPDSTRPRLLSRDYHHDPSHPPLPQPLTRQQLSSGPPPPRSADCKPRPSSAYVSPRLRRPTPRRSAPLPPPPPPRSCSARAHKRPQVVGHLEARLLCRVHLKGLRAAAMRAKPVARLARREREGAAWWGGEGHGGEANAASSRALALYATLRAPPPTSATAPSSPPLSLPPSPSPPPPLLTLLQPGPRLDATPSAGGEEALDVGRAKVPPDRRDVCVQRDGVARARHLDELLLPHALRARGWGGARLTGPRAGG